MNGQSIYQIEAGAQEGGQGARKVIDTYKKSIVVRYLGATNFRGSRLVAEADGGNRITVDYDHGLNHNERYAAAAVALCDKMGWEGDLIQAGGVGNYCAVFVFAPAAEA